MNTESFTPASESFRYRIRVRYNEVDIQAHVFNARYLDYVDVAVTEYLRFLGVPYPPALNAPEFHIVKAVLEFKLSIRADEEIDLCVRTLRVGRTSWTVLVEFRRALNSDLCAVADIVYVTVQNGAPSPVPEAIRATVRTVGS